MFSFPILEFQLLTLKTFKMKKIKIFVVLGVLFFGVLTSCTKQELDEDNQEQISKKTIQNPRDKR